MNSPTTAASHPVPLSALPPDDALREELHNEVHARPSARIHLPALIVFVVSASFIFAEIVLIKALGVGVAIAVALDATIVRALLVPATMRLFGDWNWWSPKWMQRLLAGRIASEAEAEARSR